ncbi:DNA recombination protein RmuC [Patescibacteria group bacterium]|nr:DNA recombination protein RmuC [Patescibacteria group bacterium]
MEIVLLIILILAVMALIAIVLIRNKKTVASNDDQSLLLIQNQINEMNRTLSAGLGESNKAIAESSKAIQSQFGESAKIIKEITQELTKVGEGQKQVMSITDQLKGLEDILKNPKQRGVLGEYYLETVLKNVLPPDMYQIQYNLGKDEDDNKLIPDAVVFVGQKPNQKIIPIDSKFSLENYNRLIEATSPADKERFEKLFINDLKNRIVETSKYIRPQEGTTDFAFMFIPHEAIYYDLLINKVGAITEDTENLIQRAAGKYKVIIVSPTSFLAYLQTVLQGLHALKIEESAKEIIKRIQILGKHLSNYSEFIKKLGNNLGTTVSMYNQATREFGKIDKDVFKIGGESLGADFQDLDKPSPEGEE